jgi:cbb3-type cytochrome oxidase subunit 1
MKNIDYWFIMMAIFYAILGMALGLMMGVLQDISHTPLHAHINLVGWASMALFGLIYRAYPEIASSPLARMHFILMSVGTPIMLAGIPLSHTGVTNVPVVTGSVLVFGGTIVFFINFISGAPKTL